MQLTSNIFFWVTLIYLILFVWIGFTWEEIKKKHQRELEDARADAIKRSKSTIRAAAYEEIIPFFEGFPYNTGDMKLYGKPIDYIVFDGMTEFRDGNKKKEITIIFADLKSGKFASKNPVQNAIAKAINEGRFRFEEWKIVDNKLNIK